MTSMRQVVIYPGQIAVETADIPVPAPDEALVRTLVAGVCGSVRFQALARFQKAELPGQALSRLSVC